MRLINVDDLGVGRYSKDVLPASYCAGWNGLINIINNAPTIDAVPVVRCRECKHSSLPSKMTQIYGKEGTLTCHYGPCNRRNVSMDDFCSYGKRKGSNSNG